MLCPIPTQLEWNSRYSCYHIGGS